MCEGRCHDLHVREDMRNNPAVSPCPECARITDELLCVICGEDLQGLCTNSFCVHCNEPVATSLAILNDQHLCPSCTMPNPTIFSHCDHCGAAITPSSGQSAVAFNLWMQQPEEYNRKQKVLHDDYLHSKRSMLISWFFFAPACIVTAYAASDALGEMIFFEYDGSARINDLLTVILLVILLCVFCYLLGFTTYQFHKHKHLLSTLNSANHERCVTF